MPRKKKRTISHDSLALRYALDCAIKPLRRAALDHVLAVIEAEEGRSLRIVERLGIAKSTWWEWLQAIPELSQAAYRYRDESTPGRVPEAIADR